MGFPEGRAGYHNGRGGVVDLGCVVGASWRRPFAVVKKPTATKPSVNTVQSLTVV